MSALSFEINLTGSMAPAAEGINKALAGTEKGAKHAAEGIHLFEAELGKASVAAGGFGFNLQALAKGGSLFTFDLAEGAEIALEMFKKLGEAVLEIGKDIIKTAAKTEDLNLAIELNVGKKGAANVEELAESFERTTRFDASDIKRSLLPLLKQGVSDTDTLDTVATIATDLAARNGGGIADVQQTISAFAGIFQKGRIKPQGLAEFGIQAQDKLADIAINMIAARQGGAIGGPSLRASETLGATLQRLGNAQENLFEKLAGSSGMQAVQGAISNIIDLARGPVGEQLMQNIGGAFEKIFGTLTGPEGKAKLEHIVTVIGDKLGKAITWVADKVPAIIAGFDKLPDILNRVVSYVEIFATVWAGVQVVGLITAASAALPALGTAFGVVGALGTTAFSAIGVAMAPIMAVAVPVALILGGIAITLGSIGFAIYRIVEAVKELGGLGAVWHDLKDFASSGGMMLPAVAKGNAGFDAMNAENARNLALAHGESESNGALSSVPAMASGGIVSRPTLALVGEAGPEAVIPLSNARSMLRDTGLGGADSAGGGMGGASVVFAPVVQVSGSGGDAEEIAAPLIQMVRVEFKRVLDEAGLAFGAG